MVVARPKQLGVISMEIVTDPTEIAAAKRRRAQFKLNSDWLKERASEVYSTNRGKYICIAGKEVFSADRPEDAWAMARAAHPADEGVFSHYIPLKRAPRI